MKWLSVVVLALSCTASPPSTEAPTSAPDERWHQAVASERERWARDRLERWLDVVDPGELREHVRFFGRKQLAETNGVITTELRFRQGESLFERRFTLGEGLGTGPTPPMLSRVERATQGPDALSCAECHRRGGDDGAGELNHRAWLFGDGKTLASAEPRLAPHVAGLGLVQQLALEMSADLQGAVEQTLRADVGYPMPVMSKGVEFGVLRKRADGSIDRSGLQGVDADLVVRPLGWKGVHANLRSFVRAALPQHLGLEPLPLEGTDAGLNFATLETQAWAFDGDGDRVAEELTEEQLTNVSVYLALLDMPQLVPPTKPAARQAWLRGPAVFERLGCATCHRPTLPLTSTAWTERRPGQDAGVVLDVRADVQVEPGIEQLDYARPLEVPLYSDLKRHDLGEALATKTEERGVAKSVFLTRPLWGLGTRGNAYLHDGRARTLDEAVLMHGGEAQTAADAFRAAPESDRVAVRLLLLSLRRQTLPRLVP